MPHLGVPELIIIMFVCGLPLAVLGVIVLLILRSTNNKATPEARVKCPYCAEWIMPDAKLCRYCGRDLPQTDSGAEGELRTKLD